jgi:hypothetical protein
LPIEFRSYDLFQILKIPASNYNAAGSDEKQDDERNTKEADIGFFQTESSGDI